MKTYFNEYLSDGKWQIIERSWCPERQQVNESIFALGNGYLSSRAVLEEIPRRAYPGTYIAGIYDSIGAQVTELVNIPNPVNLRIIIDGEKLGVDTMKVLKHERILDMKHGLLARCTLFSTRKKKRYNLRTIRFFSVVNPHISVMRIYLTPLDETESLTVESSVDTGITNKGLITEGNKMHVHIFDSCKDGATNYLGVKTMENEVLITYASELEVKKGNRIYSPNRRIFNLKLHKGETVRITKYISIFTSKDVSPTSIRKRTVNALKETMKKGFKQTIKNHINKWEDIWRTVNIKIDAEPDVERALNFNIYHLLIAGNKSDASIGARTLTGEGYRGHIFWDTEIFVLPFFIYTNPAIAKNMLIYRYNRLDAARKIAKEKGYQGAMFPWESADTGEEVAPSWYKRSDNTIAEVNTGLQEHHINSDIPYGVYHYYIATGDKDFMLNYGLEIILETARFWTSRAKYNKSTGKHEIKHVIGPDEFHEDVKNSAYTNYMAKWNIELATNLFKVFHRKYPFKVKRLMKKLGLGFRDVARWNAVAKKIYLPLLKDGDLIEEFQGFLKLRKLPLPERDNNNIPSDPEKTSIPKIHKTQYIKQADVLMLLYLLSHIFPAEQKKKNYLFYEKRTLHRSSLSASIHSIVAAETGHNEQAYKYFLTSLYTDLKNIYGNTSDGIHAASTGGTWQAVINGFAGMRVIKGILSFNPKLPKKWKKIRFSIKWKGFNLYVDIEKDKISLKYYSGNNRDYIFIRVCGLLHKLYPNRMTTFLIKADKLNQR